MKTAIRTLIFRSTIPLCAALLMGAASLSSAMAQTFPTKPVRSVAPYSPGSGPDAVMRILSDKLSRSWGQQLVIDNKPGANGFIAISDAKRAAPDGYTVLQADNTHMALAPHLFKQLPYDPVKDFAPITLLMSMPNLLVVHPSVPAKNVKELIAYAKQNPGKLRYGHPGNGTTPHLSAELLNQMAGLKMEGIPYKSSAQMMTDLLAGHYEVLFHNSSVVIPHARAGGARILAITSAERTASLPDVPTLAEAGNLPGFSVNAWWGLYAPAGTPPDIVNKASADVSAVIAQAEVKNWIEGQGGIPGGGAPQTLRAHQAAETARWREIVKAANIKPD